MQDTEEYINIELDSNRNRLIRLDIILTTATFAITPFNLIAGALGGGLGMDATRCAFSRVCAGAGQAGRAHSEPCVCLLPAEPQPASFSA